MTLKYRILWFEDDDEVVNEQIVPSLTQFLINQGFQLEINHHLNGEHLNNLISDRNYDLILTDLDLGEYDTGDKLIDQIRGGEILTEVLLYSANTTAISNLIVNKGWIERASFCVGLGNLREKLEGIISLTIKKNQDVNNTRGLVIAETILLEKKIEGIILKFFEVNEQIELDPKREKILHKNYERIIQKHKDDLEKVEAVSYKQIKALIDQDILTANSCVMSLQSILKLEISELNVILNSGKVPKSEQELYLTKKASIEKLKEELEKFKIEIINVRNTLAHVEEKKGADGIPFLESLNKEGVTLRFDNNEYIEIRKNLSKHNDNLDAILSHLQ